MAISYSTATPATPNRRAAGVKKAMGVGSELREDPAWIGAEEQARRKKTRAGPAGAVGMGSCCVYCNCWVPGTHRRPADRQGYAEGVLSGIAAPQPSVTSREADCQFRVTMS
jgi:hypothetical protein